jgi:hypothetical protein
METQKSIDVQFEWAMIIIGTVMSFTGLMSITTKVAVANHKAKKGD